MHYTNKIHSVSSGLKPKAQIMQTGGASDYTQEQKINSNIESYEHEGGVNSSSRVQSSKQKWKSSSSINAITKKRVQSGVQTRTDEVST
jgi:hypothetical protein